MSPILTDKDWVAIEAKKRGIHKDRSGVFSRQTRPKIQEIMELLKHKKLFKWLLRPKKPGEQYKKSVVEPLRKKRKL